MTSSPTAQARISCKAIRNRTTLVTDNPRSAVACRGKCIKLDVLDNQTRYHYMLKFEHGIEKPSKEKTF
jgi:hypothetical protein